MDKQFIVRSDVPKDPALIIKNQILLSPGKWKGQNISKEAILNGLKNTDWNDGKSNSIIYGHRTNNTSTYFGDPSPDMQIGVHTTPKYLTLGDGVSVEGMYADYHIFDTELASKLAYGGVRAGVSEGMEFDYRSGMIDKFINSSIVNNPACKNAFLNLSEDDTAIMDILEPRFLNLNEEDKKKEEKTNTYTDERGLNGKNMEKEMEEKMKALDEKMSKFETSIEEISKKLSEKKEEVTPKEEEKKEIVEEKVKEKVIVEDTKPIDEDKKPIVIDAPIKDKEDNSDAVVDAINQMGDKMAEEVKKVANPQTVAPTNPNIRNSDMDDEKVTEQLVEQFSKLHPEINSNE